MDIMKDLRSEELTLLCARIGMPAEVAVKVSALADSYDFSPLAEPIGLLFSCATAPEGVRAINAQLDSTDDAPFIWLAVWLGAALRTHEQYQRKGIADTVFYDTMGCFSRFVKEHRESYGVYGFDRSFWTYRQIAMNLFRLGTLEYEMIAYQGPDIVHDGVTALGHGDPILSVHIPSDARLDGENCHDSYKLANAFFRKYYPEFNYRVFYTNTWLLSPILRILLPEDSKILNFQKDYQIISVDAEGNGYRTWVFKNPKLEPADYPENTSLQRKIKAHVLAGGKIGGAAGIIDSELFKEGDKILFVERENGDIVVNNAAESAIINAQKAFTGVADVMNVQNENDVQDLVEEIRYGGKSEKRGD